jgi:flagellar hook-length control protein FliK
MLKAADPVFAEALPEGSKATGSSTESGGLFAELLAKLASGAGTSTAPAVDGKPLQTLPDAPEAATPEAAVDAEASTGDEPAAVLPEDLQVAATPLLPAGSAPPVIATTLNPPTQRETGIPVEASVKGDAEGLTSTGASKQVPMAAASSIPLGEGEVTAPSNAPVSTKTFSPDNAAAPKSSQVPQAPVVDAGTVVQEATSPAVRLPIEGDASMVSKPDSKAAPASLQASKASEEVVPSPVRTVAPPAATALPVIEAEVSSEVTAKPTTLLAVHESAPVVAATIKPVVSRQGSKGDAPATTVISAPHAVEDEPVTGRMPEAKSVTASAPPEPELLVEGEVPVSRDEPLITARQQTAITVRAFAQAAIASLDPQAKEGRVDTPATEPATVRGVEGVARPEAPPVLSRESSSVDGAARAASLPDPVEVPVAELGRFAVRGVRQLLHEGEQRMTLKVMPESLGEVRIEVTRQGGEVQVRMSATTQAVREMLDGQAHTLREALVREGFDSPRIQFTQQPPSSSGGGGWSGAGSQEAQQQPGHAHGNSARQGGNAPRPEAPGGNAHRPATASGGGALNVTV